MDLITLKNTLGTDRQCREYLANIRWKDGFICPHCQNNEAWQTEDIKFKCKKCGHKMSVTSGTVFQDSHTPLNKWFLAIWLVAKYGKKATVAMLQKELELGSNRTAIRMLKILRRARYTFKTEKLKVPVEITERDAKLNGKLIRIIVIAEVSNNKVGRICIFRKDYTDKKQIINYIVNNIIPDTTENKNYRGIISPLLSAVDFVGTEHKKEYRYEKYDGIITGKISNKFNDFNSKSTTIERFDLACRNFCIRHNSDFYELTFEELLGNLLKLKVRKK